MGSFRSTRCTPRRSAVQPLQPQFHSQRGLAAKAVQLPPAATVRRESQGLHICSCLSTSLPMSSMTTYTSLAAHSVPSSQTSQVREWLPTSCTCETRLVVLVALRIAHLLNKVKLMYTYHPAKRATRLNDFCSTQCTCSHMQADQATTSTATALLHCEVRSPSRIKVLFVKFTSRNL